MRNARTYAIGRCALAWGIGIAAAPASAHKPPFIIRSYTVIYEGSGSYAVTQADGPSHGQTVAHFRWKVRYPLTLIDQKGQHVTAITSSPGASGGDWSISSDNGGGETCTKTGGLKLNKFGAITGSLQRSGKLIMRLIPGSNDYATTGALVAPPPATPRTSGMTGWKASPRWGQARRRSIL